MAKVFLGVGHGGTDPGAVANGFLEKDVNLDTALFCAKVLTSHGVQVLLSRETDEDDSLEEEIRECNAYNPDLAVDIHHNAGGGKGAEVYFHFGGGVSKTLAENILSQIVAIGQNSRGEKIKLNENGLDWFGFIRETTAPAVIVECAFLDNPNDIRMVETIDKREKMGIAIAKGILQTLKIPYQEEPALEDVPPVEQQEDTPPMTKPEETEKPKTEEDPPKENGLCPKKPSSLSAWIKKVILTILEILLHFFQKK